MENRNGEYKKISSRLVLFVVMILVSSVIYYCITNYNIQKEVISGQIIDGEDKTYVNTMDSYSRFYMTKYEKSGKYYIGLKFSPNGLSELICNKKDYDGIVSGKIYYVEYKYKKPNLTEARVIEVYEHN